MGKGLGIQAAYKKYGRENFTKEVLEIVTDDTGKRIIVSEREKYWIFKLNSMEPNGYNRHPGGIGGCTKESGKKGAKTRKEKGYHHTEETKRKISISNMGKKFTKEHKIHLSENHHLRKTWTLVYEDGTEKQYTESIHKFAKQLNVSINKLLRASYKHEFINGVYIKGINKEDYACLRNSNGNKANLLCYDPILKDVCTYKNLRQRKYRKPEMYNKVILNEQIIKGE